MTYQEKLNVYSNLSRALKNGQDVVLYYQGQRSPATMRRVTPKTVVSTNFRSDGYVNGFCHLRGESRTFSFDGIIDYLFVERAPETVPTLEQQALNALREYGVNVENASHVKTGDDYVSFYIGQPGVNDRPAAICYPHGLNNDGTVRQWEVALFR